MPVLSPFQILPLRIAEEIAYYYSRTPRISSASKHDSETIETQAWLVLYDISNSWRVLALSWFCKEVDMQMHPNKEQVAIRYANLPDTIETRGTGLYRYAKRVRLGLDYADDSSSEQFREYPHAFPKDVVFPYAHTLSVDIETSRQPLLGDGDVVNAGYFVLARSIQAAIPNVRRVAFRYKHRYMSTVYLETLASEGFDVAPLLETFCDLKIWLSQKITPGHEHNNDSFLQHIAGVTTLVFKMVDNYDYIQLLATKFAPTLESLVANSLGPRFTGRLLFSDNNQPIVYPNLKTLDITGPWYGKCPDTLSTDKHFVLFPKLRYLRWGVAYIFVDDTLFRGNYDTLEYLYILLDSDSFDNLRKCGVLSAGKFPKLTHISVDNHMYHTAQVASDLLTSTVFGMITPTTRSLALEGNQILHQHIVNAIPASIYAENIQVLSFGRTHLNADKMFEIIRLLPRMTHFTCNPLNRDSKLDVQVNKPFPDWAYEKYYPLSTRLKCWVVVDTSIISIKFLVSLAIALAILCPNLSLVNIPNKCMDEYQREMNRVLGRRIYAKYAEDIKRLLYFELSTSRNSGNCYLQ